MTERGFTSGTHGASSMTRRSSSAQLGLVLDESVLRALRALETERSSPWLHG